MRYTVRVVAVISGSDMLCHVLKGGRKWKQTNWQQNPLSFLATCVNTFLNWTIWKVGQLCGLLAEEHLVRGFRSKADRQSDVKTETFLNTQET